jgi:hypothetical protein
MFRILYLLFFLIHCSPPPNYQDSSVWKKVRLDFQSIDHRGLRGNNYAKVAVHYEFCIPRLRKNWREISRIDPSAQLMTEGTGRVGCRPDQWLVVGSTHQPRYQKVLYQLAHCPYISHIEETVWE